MLVRAASFAGAIPVDDASLGKVVWRHLELDTIAEQQLNTMTPQAAGDMGQDGVPVFKLNRKRGARIDLFYGSEKLEWSFFRCIGRRCRSRCSVRCGGPGPGFSSGWTGQTFSFCLAGSARSISQTGRSEQGKPNG
jgi:hypothetical protein